MSARVDAELVHQVEEADLGLDVGVAHRGRLQAVAQRLVVELDGPVAVRVAVAGGVPVVDQRGGGGTLCHGGSVGPVPGRGAEGPA